MNDYAKVKAQNAVLKKAVLEEREATTGLRVQVRDKDRELRKTTQDLDLLRVHNHRLAKRIEVMQKDLTDASKPTSTTSSWLFGGTSASTLLKRELEEQKALVQVAIQDLQAKINENEALHLEVAEIRDGKDSETVRLNGRVTELEATMQELKEQMAQSMDANDSQLNALKAQKIKFETELQSAREELGKSQTALAVRESDAEQERGALVDAIRQSRVRIREFLSELQGGEEVVGASRDLLALNMEKLIAMDEWSRLREPFILATRLFGRFLDSKAKEPMLLQIRDQLRHIAKWPSLDLAEHRDKWLQLLADYTEHLATEADAQPVLRPINDHCIAALAEARRLLLESPERHDVKAALSDVKRMARELCFVLATRVAIDGILHEDDNNTAVFGELRETLLELAVEAGDTIDSILRQQRPPSKEETASRSLRRSLFDRELGDDVVDGLVDDIDTLVELLRLEQQPGVTDGDECALEEELLPIAPSFFLKLLEAFPPQARGGAKLATTDSEQQTDGVMVTSPEMTLPVPVVTHTVEIQTETATPKAEKDVRSSPHHESHTITSTSAQTESSPASGKLLAIDVTDTGRISIDLPADMLSDDETIQRERLLMQLYERKISDMQAAADSQKAAFTLRELRWHASDHQLAEARTRNDVLQNDVTAAQKRIFALEESMASVESNYSQQLNMMSEHVLTLNESVTGLTAELGRYRELFGPLPDLRRSPRGSAAATGGKQSGGGRR